MKIRHLRVKLILTSLPLLVLCLSALYAASYFFIMPGFQKIENESAINDAQRGVDALGNRMDQLDRNASDWGSWDEAYAFVKDHNKQFITDSLDNQALANLGIDYMLFYDTNDKLVAMKHVQIDDPNLPSESLDPGMGALLSPGSPLLVHKTITDVHQGVVILPEGIMMIVSRPILNSQAEGPSRGSIVFAQLLDAPAQKVFADLTHLKLTYLAASDAAVKTSLPTGSSDTSKVTQWVSLLSDTRAQAFATIPDINGKPNIAVRVDLARTISQRGRSSMGTFVLFAMILGPLFILSFILALDRLVVARMLVMSRQLLSLKDVQQAATAVSVSGGDELASLGAAINDLLTRLHDTYGLKQANANLEQKVAARTKELGDQLEQMKRVNGLMVDRELKMKELKEQNAKLMAKTDGDSS